MPDQPAPLSILDLAPVSAGGSPAVALRNTLDLARHAEELGYRRYWLAAPRPSAQNRSHR